MVAQKFRIAARPPQSDKKSVLDATGLVAGRLATRVAKRLLAGEEIHIVNAEKAVITGSQESIMATFHFKRDVGTRRKGPFYPRMPHLMLKRTVRGMLKYQEAPSHRAAYKRLRCYIGTEGLPKEFQSAAAESIDAAKPKTAYRFMTLGDVAQGLGAKF